MKTKNIFLFLLVFLLLSAPIFAKDLSQDEYAQNIGEIATSVAPTVINNIVNQENEENYLDVNTLKDDILKDSFIDLEELLIKATNSINDNKITPKEQYNILLLCVRKNKYEILKVLLKAGFDPVLNKEEYEDESFSIVEEALKLNYEDIATLLLLSIYKIPDEKFFTPQEKEPTPVKPMLKKPMINENEENYYKSKVLAMK